MSGDGRRALTGARVLDGRTIRDGVAVVLDGATIAGLVPETKLPADLPRQDAGGDGLLAPGFIDVQVNGGGGVLFNDAPTVATIRAIGAAHRRFGTTGFLPTLISDEPDRMRAAVEAVREGLAQGVPGLLGLHLEGPFLSPEKRGVHRATALRAPTEAELELIGSLGPDRVLVTLAPERVPPDTIARLVAAGVRVSLGHSAADHDTAARALAAGATGVTHLFNAMPPLASRAPGLVGAALSVEGCWCGVIVDGHHVHPAALKAALAAKGPERIMLVTDAMPVVGADRPGFRLDGEPIMVRGGVCATKEGVLAGAALDMATAVRNTVGLLGRPLEQALAMASASPAAFLGMADRRGRLAPGFAADLVLLDGALRVRETWIGGQPSGPEAPGPADQA